MKKILLFLILIIVPNSIYALDIKSKHVVLYNLNEDKIIYEVQANDKTSIASMTKIMTAIVAIENIDNLDAYVIITPDMFKSLKEEGAATAGFKIGEKVTYYDLLYGLMLPSGAEAAQALAIETGGNIDNFIYMMNQKAKSIGMFNTNFSTPVGLDHKDNYSTVNDIAILLKYALKNKIFKEIFMADKYVTSNKKHTFIATRNMHNLDVSFITGSKTGYTHDAGLCLASTASYNGVDYLLVTANAPYDVKSNHLFDAKTIYTYYFDNYEYRTILEENEYITTIKLKDDREIQYYSNVQERKYLPKNCKLTKEYVGKNKIDKIAIINEKIGEYIIKCDDDIIFTKDIYILQNIDKEKDNDYKYFFIISSILICLIIISIVIINKIKVK